MSVNSLIKIHSEYLACFLHATFCLSLRRPRTALDEAIGSWSRMSRYKSVASGLVVFLFTGLFWPVAQAAPITVPTGLNPGDTYRLAFVTSTTRDATSSDIADYNAFVTAAANTQAALAALSTTWFAIASTRSTDARSTTATDPSPAGPTGVPIFLLNDTKLVDDYDDLWDGFIDVQLNILENGNIGTNILVWTGTQIIGLANTVASLGRSAPSVGLTNRRGPFWIARGDSNSTRSLPLYGLSDILTVDGAMVTIPAPGPLYLLALGLFGLGFARRRAAKTAS